MVLLEKKLMVYNGILMETIGISVMVSIGLLLFFIAGFKLNIPKWRTRQHIWSGPIGHIYATDPPN